MIIQKLASGLTVRTYPPAPLTFDIDQASDDDRAAYGFPRLPRAATILRGRWETRAKQYRFIEPSFRLRARRRLGLPKIVLDQAAQRSATWAGALVEAPRGERLRWAEGVWTVPDAAPPAKAADGAQFCTSAWVGLDGDEGSNDVLQAGFDIDVSVVDGAVHRRCRPWWEWHPGGSFWIDNLPIAPGDVIDCMIQLQPGSNTAATILLANRTTKVAMTFAASAPDGTTLSGRCAEWIVEAFGNLGPLARFDEVEFSNCHAGAASGAIVSAGAGGVIDMTGAEKKTVATGALVGDAGVRVSHV